MKLLNKIKYHIFRWLMNDIGKNNKVSYDDCVLRLRIRYDGKTYYTVRDMVLNQARKAWGAK